MLSMLALFNFSVPVRLINSSHDTHCNFTYQHNSRSTSLYLAYRLFELPGAISHDGGWLISYIERRKRSMSFRVYGG